MKKFRYLLALVVLIILMCTVPVSVGAVTYTYHGNIYSNQTMYADYYSPAEIDAYCADKGGVYDYGNAFFRSDGYYEPIAWNLTLGIVDGGHIWYSNIGCNNYHSVPWPGYTAKWYPTGQWNETAGDAPVQYSHDITVNVKTSGGINLPRANVEIHTASGITVFGPTGLDGNFSAGCVSIYNNYQPYITVTKAGFNVTNYTPSWNLNSSLPLYANIVMGDLIPPTGGRAQVYVDIIDIDTGAGIAGATVGIENTTATTNQWYYYTEPNSTATFTTTGIWPQTANLSVGQAVVFSGYKTGSTTAYTANNSGTYVIPSAISHTQLLLRRTTGNTSAFYYWPVTVVDASTGVPIGNSNLSQALECAVDYHDCVWYNRTSSDGKFNVTGYGSSGSTPLSLGDFMVLFGSAPGYSPNGYVAMMTAATNGVTQPIGLALATASAKPGEFTAVVSTYEKTTSVAISGVTVSMGASGAFNSTKITSSYGTAVFTNLSSNLTYTLSATKSGYSPVTQLVSGASGTTQYVYVQLSSGSVNPTPYPTVTTVGPTPTTTGSAAAQSAIDYLSSWVQTFMVLGCLVVFMWLFWQVVYNLTGGKVIEKLMKRGRR